MTTIAFIGLGHMGTPMSKNLLKAGYDVIGFDLAQDALASLVQSGGRAASSIADAVRGADAVITMVPTGTHVRQVYEGDAGILAHARRDALLIDSSTIDVETSRVVHALAAGQGFAMVDAPVSGAVPAAEAGKLVFMVGGEAANFVRAELVLRHMGSSVVHVGAAGTGQSMKACNNMMAGMTAITLSETLALARRLGLDDQKVYDVMTHASGNCWMLQSYCPVPGPVPGAPSNRDYAPGFAMALMLKDMRLSQKAAQAVDYETPFAARATQMYEDAVAQGHGGRDFSYMFKIVSGED
ncbi:3-hydroxyisobutyrate dehydrogenase [Castellaniella sp. MT123]|uniref:3-hydroxyisobutyrate dehydrogenase n=1 Tax=Castellaniella sp. MT123 TaxID=3140381 RepID=UPI0031F36079